MRESTDTKAGGEKVSAFVLTGDIGDRDPGVRLYFGNPGSGKSYALRRDVIAAARYRTIVIVDATREWALDNGTVVGTDIPGGMPVAGARTVPRTLDLLDAMPRGLIIFHPRIWVEDTASLVACLTVRNEPIGVAISEAHNLMPSGVPLTPGFDAMVTRWRHLRMGAWLDTQRPARLARTVTELATIVHLFAVNGPRDADAVSELVNDPKALLATNEESCRRLAMGEPGWHVKLGIDRSPPYNLVRV